MKKKKKKGSQREERKGVYTLLPLASARDGPVLIAGGGEKFGRRETPSLRFYIRFQTLFRHFFFGLLFFSNYICVWGEG